MRLSRPPAKCYRNLFSTAQVKGDYNLTVAKSAMGAGLAMQKRVERTVVVVFVTFLLRAVYNLMFAAAFVRYEVNPHCPVCADCQSTLTAMGVWFIASPGFHVITNLLAAPVASVLAIFGIFLTKRDLRLLLDPKNRTGKDSRNTPSRDGVHVPLKVAHDLR